MTRLSVNLNKVALLRNSRDTRIPSVVNAAVTSLGAGARGITVHPRPDQRHIRPQDVHDLALLLQEPHYADIEFNIEGNPFAGAEPNGFPGFMNLVRATRPHQATLVPDNPDQLTSDHGWDLSGDNTALIAIIAELKDIGCRVSLFMDPVNEQIERAASIGADRIEFYTGPYADAFFDHKKADGSQSGHGPQEPGLLENFIAAARLARNLGLGINAGHDLNQANLGLFCARVAGVEEVSIGHAIIADALWSGLETTVKRYHAILENPSHFT